MPNEFEGAPTPTDQDAIDALAEAEREEAGESPKEPVKQPEDKPEESDKETEKPKRTPTMVEAYKLKIAEDQKASAEKQVADLQAKLDELSKQKSPVTEKQKEDISDDIEELVKEAEESGADGAFIRKLANTLLAKAEAKSRPSDDVSKTIKELNEEKELVKQERLYSSEFSKDIEPLVKEQFGLSDTALSELKTKLKDLAFSETYAKVPLVKIFKAEFDSFDIKEIKKSSEGKGIKARAEVVDFDNLDEKDFENLPEDKLEAFIEKKTSGGWNSPRK